MGVLVEFLMNGRVGRLDFKKGQREELDDRDASILVVTGVAKEVPEGEDDVTEGEVKKGGRRRME